MKSYLLKFSGREEGPYGEAQIAQMFADGRIDRNTPCKLADRGDDSALAFVKTPACHYRFCG
jgi:hypothetical protein